MNKILYIVLISLFSLTVISCAKEEEKKAPVIAEVYPVTTPTDDPSPNYTFSSTKAGTITYGGSCSSGTTSATSGNNTITFLTLSDGTYSDCTIIVTDSAGNASNTLTITSFTVIQLSAPANLTATGADSKVTLDWTVLSGATSYNVYWDNATGVSSSSTAITGISTDNYTHSSLNNGTTYYYKVAAVDSNGATGFLSSEVNSTPMRDYALDFDGTNDYVAADGVTSNLDSSTGLPFTVSAWAYPDTADNGAIFAFNKTGNTDENLN